MSSFETCGGQLHCGDLTIGPRKEGKRSIVIHRNLTQMTEVWDIFDRRSTLRAGTHVAQSEKAKTQVLRP